MRKIKVVLIQGLLAPYRYPIFEELSNNKEWDFEVWFMGKSVKNRIWSEEELGYYNFKKRFLNGFTFNLGINDNYPFWFNPHVVYEILKAKPDVLVMYGWDSVTSFLAHITCKIFGIKFILYSDSTVNEKSWRRLLTYPIVKAHVLLSDGLIAGGTMAKKYLERIGALSKNIKVSYNSVDVKRCQQMVGKFRNRKIQTKQSLKIKGPVVMFYGQLIRRKGVDLLIQAFDIVGEKFKNITLLIVGDGIEEKSLKSLASRVRHGRIIFIPNPGDRMVCKYYAISDLFVLPSREEVWGLVVNEAMSAGLPVVVSEISGSAKDLVVDDFNGYKFETNSIFDLAEKIEMLLSDETKAVKFGKNSLELIKSFDSVNAAKPYFDLVKSLEISQWHGVNENSRVVFNHKQKKNYLSIIIPVKDDSVGLELTLRSILNNHTKNNYEIIVVNDGSSNKISQLCSDFKVKEVAIPETRGSYYSRNLGMKNSLGQYLAFIDAGTCASSDWIDIGMGAVKKYEYVGGPIHVENTNNINNVVYSYEQICEFPVKYFLESLHFVPTTNLFVRRKIIEKYGGFDSRLFSSGDLEFGDRIYNSSVSQVYIENLRVTHPARTYIELCAKHARLIKGSVQLNILYRNRFSILPNNIFFFLIKSVIPPIWIFNINTFAKMNHLNKLLTFITAFHFSLIANLSGVYYSVVLPRQHAKSRAQ